ncbi:hypothetical protein [Pseudomonas sp.]|uniref:hypothetical protein n=1 Tax=Pseudomonas sp. TaxID=306 RepID=UPI003C794A74
MTGTKGKVIHLHQRDPKEALERLNRITGLRFSSWPQSLVHGDTAVDKQPEISVSTQPEREATVGPAGMVSG